MSVFIVVNEDVIADGLGEEYKKAVREFSNSFFVFYYIIFIFFPLIITIFAP